MDISTKSGKYANQSAYQNHKHINKLMWYYYFSSSNISENKTWERLSIQTKKSERFISARFQNKQRKHESIWNIARFRLEKWKKNAKQLNTWNKLNTKRRAHTIEMVWCLRVLCVMHENHAQLWWWCRSFLS